MLPKNARIDRDTPQSFVERMAAGLRAYAQAKRDAVPHSSGYSELPSIAGRVDALASWVGVVDGSDSRLYAQMVAAGVLRDPDNVGQWRPGTEMSRVLSRLGTNGEFDADHALTELTAAALEDVLTTGRYALALAESERDRLRTEVGELADIKAAVDHQKARLGVTQLSREVDIAAAARDARNAVLAAAREETATPTRVEEAPDELPTGVRRRGKGFQAYARIHGEQWQDQFATVDEAVKARDAKIAEREGVAA